jgi:predicted transcriptional regulator
MSSPAQTIFDEIDPEAEERALQDGERAADAGRLIPHEAIARWLLSWGTQDELPAPTCAE